MSATRTKLVRWVGKFARKVAKDPNAKVFYNRCNIRIAVEGQTMPSCPVTYMAGQDGVANWDHFKAAGLTKRESDIVAYAADSTLAELGTRPTTKRAVRAAFERHFPQ